MNKKYTYVYTGHYDPSIVANNFGCESEYIITDGDYDFCDFMKEQVINTMNNDLKYLYDNHIFDYEAEIDDDGVGYYYIIDVDEGERTGEVYLVKSVEDTDEDLFC